MEDFKTLRLNKRVTIIEAMGGDVHGWENGDEETPAFLTYIGCESMEEAKAVKDLLLTDYGCWEVQIRKGRRTGFQFECKAYGVLRVSYWHYGLSEILSATDFNSSLSARFALAMA